MISLQPPPAGDTLPTLDQMLRLNAQRLGNALALVDAPDRPLWADGAPRRMTWNQVDVAVSAIAARFFELGLPGDAVVCIQGLNVTDTLIGILGCLRAGLVAAVIPVGSRPGEILSIAERVNAKAVLSAHRVGDEKPLRNLRHLVGESIADIRFVGAFGADLPGGIVSFENCIGFPKPGGITRLSRKERREEGLAILTFDRDQDAVIALARTHLEWFAAASVFVEGLQLGEQSRLLTTISPTSAAGLASGMVAWLASGCQLILHQGFDSTVMGVQMTMHGVSHVILPGIVLQAALAEGLFEGRPLERIAGLVRESHRPLRLQGAPCSTPCFAVLGEVGILPLSPEADGYFELPSGLDSRHEEGSPIVETRLSEHGHLMLRGREVPAVGFDVSEHDAFYPFQAEGWVSTQYPAIPSPVGWRITGARYTAPRPALEPPQDLEDPMLAMLSAGGANEDQPAPSRGLAGVA